MANCTTSHIEVLTEQRSSQLHNKSHLGADWTAQWPIAQQVIIPSNTICTRSGCDHRTELLRTAERQLFLIFNDVRLVSAHYDQHYISGTTRCSRHHATWLLLALAAALLWQQLGRLTCTCIWVEIAQSATDTTEGGDEISHCLQAFARWQQSSYQISTILNLSGLNRPELESDNSPPLNARVKKTLTPYIVPYFTPDVSFIAVLSTAAYRTESPHSPGHLVTAALLTDTV